MIVQGLAYYGRRAVAFAHICVDSNLTNSIYLKLIYSWPNRTRVDHPIRTDLHAYCIAGNINTTKSVHYYKYFGLTKGQM